MENNDKAKREILRKRKEIEYLSEQIKALQEDLKSKILFVEGMEETLKFINKSNSPSKNVVLRPGSDLDKVRKLLLESDTPLHINLILGKIGKEETKAAKLSLAGSLSSYVRKNQIFTKPNPNTFGLISKAYAEDFDDLST